MTLNEIVANTIPKEVRIVASTCEPFLTTRAMIGKEYKVSDIDLSDGTIVVFGEDEDSYTFNLSDVRFLTPLSFKGERIAIGDEVEEDGLWHTVYGYRWDDGEWRLNALVSGGSVNVGCFSLDIDEITNHRTGEDDEVAKAIALLESRGKIKDGKILSN